MKLQLDKIDLSWLHKNGFISVQSNIQIEFVSYFYLIVVGILWDQLSQRCDPVPGGGFANQNTTTTKNVEIPNINGTFLGVTKTTDICIAYSSLNGDNLARSLQQRIAQRNKKVTLAFSSGELNPKEVEKTIASSSSLLVLLTEACLKQVEVVFALNVAKFYFDHPSLVILVHDAESCFFPGYEEQPESVKEFFSEKAVTFLNCYPEIGVTEIVEKFESEMKVLNNILENFKQKPTDALRHILAKHEHRKEISVAEIRSRLSPFMTSEQLDEFVAIADKNKDGILQTEELQEALNTLKNNLAVTEKADEHEDHHEDLTTRVFLSHKRSTGQGIAGRLYEGLKSDYAIFIDSEAKFKIHNLKLIVQSTDVFVFILTYGILLSKWCLEELKSAVENKKKVIVVRELSYKLPTVLPEEWQEVEGVLRKSPELIWLAEYNSACVDALRTFIGSPVKSYRSAERYLKTDKGQENMDILLKKLQTEKILDFTNTTVTLPEEIGVDGIFDMVLRKVAAEDITGLHIAAPDSILKSILLRLPNLQELKTIFDDEEVIKQVFFRYPSLKKLTLGFSYFGSLAPVIAAAKELQYLDISHMQAVTNETVHSLTEGCRSLETLKMKFTNLNLHFSNLFAALEKLPKLRNLALPYWYKNSEDCKKYQEENPLVNVDAEPTFIDVSEDDKIWYPGIVEEWNRTERMRIHVYCKSTFAQVKEGSWNSAKTAPFLSHKENYSTQGTSHGLDDSCIECSLLHPPLQYVRFDGMRNLHYATDWVFEEEAGKILLANFISTARKGYLRSPFIHIDGYGCIPAEMIAKEIFDKVDPNTITALYTEATRIEISREVQQQIPYWIENLKNLKTFANQMQGHLDLPETLEVLDISHDSVGYLVNNIAKLPNLHTLRISDTDAETNRLLVAFQQNNKLHTLTIRNCQNMNKTVLVQIAKTCKEIATLDIAMNPKLKPNCASLLMKEFPSLKKLYVDLPVLNSPHFQELKQTRPDVVIDGLAYLKDVYDEAKQQWFPAVQISENRAPGGEVTYHLYGAGTCKIKESNLATQSTSLLSHSDNYGEQDNDACYSKFCYPCSILTPLCKDLKFAGKLNPFNYADRYFQTDDGKDLLAKYAPQGSHNRVQIGDNCPPKILPFQLLAALSKEHPDKKFLLEFDQSSLEYRCEIIEQIIEMNLPIIGLEFREFGRLQPSLLDLIEECLPNLTRLVWSHCNEKPDFKKLAVFKELVYLDISGSQASAEELINLVNCTKLAHLDLAVTQATDHVIADLAKHLVDLTYLNLRGSNITEKSVESIVQNCPKLEFLDIGACALPVTVCKLLQGLPKVKEVKLPYVFANTEELRSFTAANPSITVETNELLDTWGPAPAIIISYVGTKICIHRYGVPSSSVVDNNPDYVKPFLSDSNDYRSLAVDTALHTCQYCRILDPLLKDVKFGGKGNIRCINDWYLETDEGKEALKSACETVKSTGKLDGGMKVTWGLSVEVLLKAVLQTVPEDIKELVCCTVSTADLDFMLSKTSNLQSLGLHGQFEDEHIILVAEKKPSLKSLSLFYCNITDDGLHAVSGKLHSIQTLSIKYCRNITDEGVKTIVTSNPSLEEIELDFHQKLTEKSFGVLTEAPRLKTFKVICGRQNNIQEAISQFKTAQPQVSLDRSPLLVDCQAGYYKVWLPGWVVEYDEQNNKVSVLVAGSSTSEWINESDTTEAFSHSNEYGTVWSLENTNEYRAVGRKFLFGDKPLGWLD